MSEQPLGDSTTDDTGRDDDLATLLARREHAKPNKATWVLLTLLVLIVGFIGGAATFKKFGASSNASRTGLPSGIPAGFAGPAGSVGSGPSGGGNGFAGMTAGTVKLVDGSNLYITTSSGDTVKVKVPEGVSVTTRTTIPLADLKAGSSVLIRGDTATDGTIAATAVTEGALPAGPPGQQSEPQPSTSTGATP